MAVLGNRATGVLDMLIEGFRRSGQTMEQPNMTQVAPTPLQQAMNRPVSRLTSTGDISTIMPDGGGVAQTAVPLIQDLARGRVLNPINPMQDMGQPMPVSQALEQDKLRAAAQQTQATPDNMGMEKLASDAARAVEMGAAESTDPTIRERIQSYFGGRENMLRLAMAFNTMRLQPDAGLTSALSAELKDVRALQIAQDQKNKTASYFDKLNPKIAAAIRGGLSAKDAIALYKEEQKGVVVGKMIVNPTTGEIIYDGTKQGSDLPATYRSLQLRAEEAGLTPGTEEYKQFMINGGQRSGLSIKVNEDGSFEITEGGSTSTGKKMSEAQSNALQFGGRMTASGLILNQMEQQGTRLFESIVQNVPIAGNYLLSPEYQSYVQAKRDFINAVLRKESGAAIAASEFDNADKQYFPQPGDSQQVIDQKRANRELATKLMMSGVPIKGLTQDPKVVLENVSKQIPKPAGVAQQLWDAMNDEEKLAFK